MAHTELHISPTKSKSRGGKHTRPLLAISLFSGAGGLDLGIEAAGFQTRCCVEIDDHSCRALELNRDRTLGSKKAFLQNATILQRDIRTVTGQDLLSAAGVERGEVALLYGGPPCQAFSVFGRRQGLRDSRGTLIWEFVRLVRQIYPEAFLLENVSGLKTYKGRTILSLLEEELSLNGEYAVSTHEYELADYGVPQFRRRIFIIGSRKKPSVPPIVVTHSNSTNKSLFKDFKAYRTVREALRGLPDPKDNGHFYNHIGREHSDRIIRRYSSLEFGQRDPKTRINKLHPERPSFTIIVGSDAGGGKGHVHPFSPREVTPRESARMQTFPDSWQFSGTSRHPIRQVGNAVPPLFAALLGSHLRKHLFDAAKALSYETAIEALGLDYLR